MADIKDLTGLANTISNQGDVSDEQSFKACWLRHYNPDWCNEQLAFAGGLIADRLAFLFLAGYQAAVRRTFSDAFMQPGWAVLAVSEDRSPENPKPGLTLGRDGNLNGFKTWVAAVENVDQIVVSAGDQYIKVSRDHPGLTLHTKPNPGFLAEMSQGIAEFSDAPVTEVNHLPGTDIRLFAKREPLYLYLAFCGFLTANAPDTDCSDWLDALCQLADTDFSDDSSRTRFAEVDTAITRTMQEIDPELFSGNYAQDIGLVSLYSKGIQKRAGN